MRFHTFLLILLILSVSLTSPATAQDLGVRPLQKLIDCPSAGGPESGSYDFELRVYPDGGVLAGFTAGLIGRLGIGFFYGGTGIIGYNSPDWNIQPGVLAMCRILDESYVMPAITIGFTNQGYGAWIDSTNRYQYKAKGYYLALGKNFKLWPMGEICGHFGVNMNPTADDSKSLDFYTGVDFRLIKQLGFIGEYSAGLNDRKGSSLGKGRGYLNLGIRWTFAERLAIDLHLRDVIINQNNDARGGAGVGREIRISYVENL